MHRTAAAGRLAGCVCRGNRLYLACSEPLLCLRVDGLGLACARGRPVVIPPFLVVFGCTVCCNQPVAGAGPAEKCLQPTPRLAHGVLVEGGFFLSVEGIKAASMPQWLGTKHICVLVRYFHP